MSVTNRVLAPPNTARPLRTTTAWWLNHDAARNWLALGLLLSAWNTADDGVARERPDTLRGYDAVSVRAMQRTHPDP